MNPSMPNQMIQQPQPMAPHMQGVQNLAQSFTPPATLGEQLGNSIQRTLSPVHHAVYEKLRQVLMNLHTQGIPGIDSVLHALNKEHVNQMKGGNKQMPTMPNQPQAMPQAPSYGGYLGQMQQVQQQMPGGGR